MAASSGSTHDAKIRGDNKHPCLVLLAIVKDEKINPEVYTLVNSTMSITM